MIDFNATVRAKEFVAAPWAPRPELLLCANTVRPMHGVVPRVILGESWWNATRRAAYRSTDYHCNACGVHQSAAECHQWLEGHELYDTNYCRGRMTYVETVPLCHYCHNYIHDGRLTALRDKGEITPLKHATVMIHGQRVLRRAGITQTKLPHPKTVARWHKWRLVLNGREYPPLYRNEAAWAKAFGHHLHHDRNY